jgi:hypothetical protein
MLDIYLSQEEIKLAIEALRYDLDASPEMPKDERERKGKLIELLAGHLKPNLEIIQ